MKTFSHFYDLWPSCRYEEFEHFYDFNFNVSNKVFKTFLRSINVHPHYCGFQTLSSQNFNILVTFSKCLRSFYYSLSVFIFNIMNSKNSAPISVNIGLNHVFECNVIWVKVSHRIESTHSMFNISNKYLIFYLICTTKNRKKHWINKIQLQIFQILFMFFVYIYVMFKNFD